jgi:hypothetical protein
MKLPAAELACTSCVQLLKTAAADTKACSSARGRDGSAGSARKSHAALLHHYKSAHFASEVLLVVT